MVFRRLQSAGSAGAAKSANGISSFVLDRAANRALSKEHTLLPAIASAKIQFTNVHDFPHREHTYKQTLPLLERTCLSFLGLLPGLFPEKAEAYLGRAAE